MLVAGRLAPATELVLPPADIDLVGQVRFVPAREEDTLLDIARRHDLGQNEILLANPHVDRWLPGAGTEVLLPTRYILPRAPREGIVLNVPEMRLYYFPPAKPGEPRSVITHPVSIGRMDWATPVGVTRVATKVTDPSWRPPESIRKEAEARGEPLPELIPPGPDNPLGRYALRLALPGYLIHSTNRPYGVGMRVTHGCVRMYPEDIETIFPQIPVGTPVHIVNQPIKVGWLADTLFLEVHPPLEEDSAGRERLLDTAFELLEAATQGRRMLLSGAAIRTSVEERRGIPIAISSTLREE